MGGNVFKKIETRRIESKQEYRKKVDEIKHIFSDYKLEFNFLSEVPAYENKESFGDIDFIYGYSSEENKKNIINIIKEIFEDVNINDDVVSFVYDSVQIDFIFVDIKDSYSSLFFYSYNDMGLLLGKLCYYNHLTLGPNGLRIKVYDGEMKLFDQVITNDTPTICKFLGLDWNTWNVGFKTLEEIFDYVMSSKLYDERAFDSNIWNSRQRLRDSKRINLKKFLNYIEMKKNKPRPTKEKTFSRINTEFPYLKLEEKKQEIIINIEREKKAKEKFNGHIVAEKYDLVNDKEILGYIMREFNSKFESKEDRINFILTNSEENIFKVIDEIIEMRSL